MSNLSKPIQIRQQKSDESKIKDLSFSVYVDNKIKNTPPREDFLEQHIQSIYPKCTNEWVDSDLVVKCQNCTNKFNWYYRKHHCRACGGVFCYNCCYKYIVIPIKLLEIPKESNLWRISAKKLLTKVTGTHDETKSLVCNDCHIKIIKLLEIPKETNLWRISAKKLITHKLGVISHFPLIYGCSAVWWCVVI